MLEGGCFCGKVRYQVDGAPFYSTLCHCVDCRRIAGAPCVAWFSVGRSGFRFVAGVPASLASSPAVVREFCADCGTHLTYRRDDRPDEIDVTTCSLDVPEQVAPADHTWVSQKMPWLQVSDTLPRHAAAS